MLHGTTLLHLCLLAETLSGTAILSADYLYPGAVMGAPIAAYAPVTQSVRGSKTIFYLLPRTSFHHPKLSFTVP